MLEWFGNLNNWIVSHQALVVTLGMPLLTLAVTTLATNSASRRANEERRAERALQRELKRADFRRDWIEETRSELAKFNALIGGVIEQKELGELAFLLGQIQMKINPDDPLAFELKEKMIDLMANAAGDDDVAPGERQARMRGDYCETARQFLKAEWVRLNADLEKVD